MPCTHLICDYFRSQESSSSEITNTVTLSQIPVPRSVPNFMSGSQAYAPSPLTPGHPQGLPYPNCATVASSMPSSSNQAMSVGYNTAGMQFTFPHTFPPGYIQQAGVTPVLSSSGDMRVNPPFSPTASRMMPTSNNFMQQPRPNSETSKQNNGNSSSHGESVNSVKNVSENDQHLTVNSASGDKRTNNENRTKSKVKDIPSETKTVSFPGLANLMKPKAANTKEDDDDYDS